MRANKKRREKKKKEKKKIKSLSVFPYFFMECYYFIKVKQARRSELNKPMKRGRKKSLGQLDMQTDRKKP